MSRQISIWYEQNKKITDIDIGEKDLLGTQDISYKFWSMPILKEMGLERLIVLGYTDPIYFGGWEDLADLDKELSLLEGNIEIIDFDEETKKRWFSNLRFSLNRLVELSPKDSWPVLGIG